LRRRFTRVGNDIVEGTGLGWLDVAALLNITHSALLHWRRNVKEYG